MTAIPQGSTLEVLDFELRNAALNERYYKVRFNNQDGYVYAGTSQNYLSWIRPAVENNNVPTFVARVGQSLQITINGGINMRATPGGNFIERIPQQTKLQVLDVVIRNTANEVYYKISYNGRIGYIYSGVLQPTNTVKSWTQVL